MIEIKNATNIKGEVKDYLIESSSDKVIDATGLTIMPALTDPHVHFRVPGAEHKENWVTGARAAIAGGVTTVLDMPNNNPSITTKERLQEKKQIINEQLEEAEIPLRYQLYIGATEDKVNEIENAKGEYVGIKVFLGQSTGDLLMQSQAAFEKVCETAAKVGAIVAVHSEDDLVMNEAKRELEKNKEKLEVTDHPKIRHREAAIAAMKKAIAACKKYGNRMYILHASTKEEVDLIKEAKADGLDIFLETTPHHLFLDEVDLGKKGTMVQMNPPLRTKADIEALWQGLRDGTVDTIGTDHAPHTLEEKQQPYGQAPSGVPGIENYLALLLNANKEGKISLEKIVETTQRNINKIFGLEPNKDVVLVDLNKTKTIEDSDQKTKCGWSPYSGMTLTGWPVYTIMKGKIYKI